MNNQVVTYCQARNYWLGYIDDYHEFITQGLKYDELIVNLKDIYHVILIELLPGKL